MKFVCFTAAILATVLEEQSNAFVLNKALGEAPEGANLLAQRWTESYGDLENTGLSLSEIAADIENNELKLVKDETSSDEEDSVEEESQGT